jgi:hypothetical protein
MNVHRVVWLCSNLRHSMFGHMCGVEVFLGGSMSRYGILYYPSGYYMVPAGKGSGIIDVPYQGGRGGGSVHGDSPYITSVRGYLETLPSEMAAK